MAPPEDRTVTGPDGTGTAGGADRVSGAETGPSENTNDGPPWSGVSGDPSGRWAVVIGASIVSAAMAAYELVPASVTPLIREGLTLGPADAGWIVSVMFGTAVVASIPVGIVLDRTDSRRAIALAVFGFMVAGIWGWWAATIGDFRLLLGSRALGGLAYVVVWNAGIDIVGRAFETKRRATAVGTFTASGPAGFALGQFGGPPIAAVFGWPAVFVAFVVPALGGLIAFWPASRGRGRSAPNVEPPTAAELRRVLTDRRVWTVGVLGFLAYSLYLFVNSWLPSYLVEELGLSLAISGVLAALFPAIGILGRTGGGALSDRLFGGGRRPVIMLAFLIATPAVVGVAIVGHVTLLAGLVLVAGLGVQLALGLQFAYVRELVAPTVAATAVAFQTAIGLLGATAAPVIAGVIIGYAGYGVAFIAFGGVGVVGLVLASVAPRANP